MRHERTHKIVAAHTCASERSEPDAPEASVNPTPWKSDRAVLEDRGDLWREARAWRDEWRAHRYSRLAS